MIRELAMGATLAFAAAAQPGPFLAYLAQQTIAHGWKRTLPAMFAPIVSDVPVALVVLLVLRRMPPELVRALHVAGGVLLLGLAFVGFRALRARAAPTPAARAEAPRGLLRAALVNIANPGPWLGWSLVLGPLFVEAWARAPVNGIALVVAFYATMVVTLAAVLGLLARAAGASTGMNRGLGLLTSAAMAAFGVYQLWSAWRG